MLRLTSTHGAPRLLRTAVTCAYAATTWILQKLCILLLALPHLLTQIHQIASSACASWCGKSFYHHWFRVGSRTWEGDGELVRLAALRSRRVKDCFSWAQWECRKRENCDGEFEERPLNLHAKRLKDKIRWTCLRHWVSENWPWSKRSCRDEGQTRNTLSKTTLKS